jgi:hypothetical protein
MTGWYTDPPGDSLPESAYEARSRAGGCPCGCQEDDGELDTPVKVRTALLRMTEFRAMEGP